MQLLGSYGWVPGKLWQGACKPAALLHGVLRPCLVLANDSQLLQPPSRWPSHGSGLRSSVAVQCQFYLQNMQSSQAAAAACMVSCIDARPLVMVWLVLT
jgi:hypothetical protein